MSGDQPLGVMPEFIWKEKRLRELIRATHEYLSAGTWNAEKIREWITEAEKLTRELWP